MSPLLLCRSPMTEKKTPLKEEASFSERQKLLCGEYGDTSDSELQAIFRHARRTWMRLNTLAPESPEFRATLEELIPGVPESVFLSPPFYCDQGRNISLGEHVFINYNCSFLDGGGITIGHHTLIGPSVQIYTPQHPMDYMERRKTIERSPAVRIGNDCWIGGGSVICPGVTIGDRCIIAAGSVVVRDVPDDSLAAGNPAVIKKKLL